MVKETALKERRQEGTRVVGAPYPPATREPTDRQQRPVYPVRSTSKPRLLREPSIDAQVARAGDDDPRGNDDPVIFHRYETGDAGDRDLTNAADMSGADSERDVVMMSGNWYCDVSNDGGGTFKRLDPTTIFPAGLGGGFCCDQIIIYVASIDHFVWFMQHQPDATGQGAFRIATASSGSVHDDPTAWTFWDFHAGNLGQGTNDMDYPDLAFSSQFLYVSTDVFNTGGRIVLRIPLQELAAGGTINFGFTDPTKSKSAWGAHLVQQSQSQAVWVGHRNNSTLEVFVMPDAGNTYSSFTVNVATWPNGSQTSTGPDGNDWLTKMRNFPKFAVTGGAARDGNRVALAWTASNGKGSANGFNFPNTHIRVAEIDMGSRTLVSEMQVWNKDYAFAYPSLAVNAKNELGIMLGWGGTTNHANCAMGVIGDFVVWFRDGSTRTVQRFGDYITTRRGERNRLLFAGFGYFVTEVAGQPGRCTYNPFYVRYGRASA